MSRRDEALERAARLYRSAQCRQAYVAGAAARGIGKAADACPYPPEARTTWRTSLRRAWERGYDSLDGDLA